MSTPDDSPEVLLRKSIPGLDAGCRFFYGDDSLMFWNGFFLMIGAVAAVPACLTIRSIEGVLGLVGGFVVGAAVWYAGRWVLRRNCYFIGESLFGYRDIFRTRFVRFDEVTNIRVRRWRQDAWLEIECRGSQSRMPLDLDAAWLDALKEQCAAQGIPVS